MRDRDPAVLSALCLTVLVAGLTLESRPAAAHQASISHARAQVSDDRRTLTYELEFTPADVAEPLGLDADAEPTDEQVLSGQAALLSYVLARVRLEGDDQACPVTAQGDDLGVRMTTKGGRFVAVTVRMRCAAAIETLAIEYDLFFDIDALHRNILTVRHAGRRAVAELDWDGNRFVWELAKAPPSDNLGFIKSGIEHIAMGYDHIAFLIGLLLVVTIVLDTRGEGARPEWHVRELMSGLRYTATIVTSFTVAHSITLIAASLHWIDLSSRVVESLIAMSIAYVAIENMVRPQTRVRYLITFGFGLMHGMGFASVLSVMLPPEDVIWPLLLFNVGVEIGQLSIVIVVLPMLHMATRAMGARAYRDWALPIGSGLIALLGLAWLVERVFDTVLLGF